MTIADRLLERIASLGVSLTARHGRLVYRAPRGVMTPDLMREIKGREKDLLRRLAAPDGADIPRLAEADRYLPSHAQRRLWILDQLAGPMPVYHIPLLQIVDGPLDVDALRQAFARLVDRHEALRTVFDTVEGAPRQRVVGHIDLLLRTSDFSGATDPDAAARTRARDAVATPFDLDRGPLFRVELARLGVHRHLLLVVLHHLIADGVSITVLARDVGELYAAIRESRLPTLPPLRIQYRDFAAWQNAFLDGPDAAAHRAYWMGKLAAPLPVLDLPGSHPRPAHSSLEGREELFEIDRETVQDLRVLCRAAGASLFMGLIAAVTALLHRYTGSEDIVIGSPVAGRDHVDAEHAIGVFINTIVLRNQVRSSMSFRELLASVARNTVEALDHRSYPFDRLVEDLELPRDLGRSPVFDVMVILQNQETGSFALQGLQVTPVYLHTATSKLDLTFNFHESRGHVSLGLEYRTDLFEAGRVQRLGRHLLAMLRQAAHDPGRPLARLEMLLPQERQLVLEQSNRTARESPGDLTLLDLFRRQVQERQDAMAVTCGGTALTYRELDARSNRVASLLRLRGAGPERLVGICVERSAEMLVGLLGILKTGAAYVPLDPAFPRERLAFMMRDSRASLLLTEGRLAPLIAADGAATVLLEEATAQPGGMADAARTTVGSLAYVNYTSGSTGTPKGVAVTHQNLTNLLLTMAQAPGVSSMDVLLAVTTLSFDIAGLELYLPLVTGGRVVIATSDEAADGWRLRDLLKASAATVMQATPATWRLLLAAGWRSAPHLKVLCGGEALPGSLAASLLRASADVWNLYGPTETTIWSAAYRVGGSPDDWEQRPVVPIGHAVANTTMYVVDRDLNPVPSGCHGDLYIGGDGVARGYLNRPELTAERFIPDPFSVRPGARLYRTGDRATFRDDGTIEFLGRDDRQVKIRGFRIELGEIELALERYPAVAQGVVVASNDAGSAATLVAYVIPSGARGIDRADVRAHLKRLLPEYMIPSLLVVLERLPLTPNGKVDRNALPRPSRSSLADVALPTAPRDDLERRLAAVWAQVLALDEVGIHDNFFELGGHSLRATRAVYELQLALGIHVELIDIFKAPTVAALAARLSTRLATPDRISGPNRPFRGLASPAEHAIPPITAEERDLLEDL